MASMRDIKRRIKSVNSTQQITKAMNLVASSKLTRARNRLLDTRPFFNETRSVIAELINSSGSISNPFLEKRDVKNCIVILITGDRGLCGGYNVNISKLAMNYAEKGKAKAVTIGSKGRDYLKRRNVEIIKSFTGISENPKYSDAQEISKLVIDMFTKGETDEVYIAYTEFKSTISHEPKLVKLLPADADDFKTEKDKDGVSALTIYEPSEEAVLEYVIPKYVNTVIFGAMVESAVCELGARMTAMDSATDNAADMIDTLNLLYNRARQGAITQEITEIVSGSGIYD